MSDLEIKREILPGGSIRLSSGDCAFLYKRPRSGVLHVTISGHDTGQFGTSTLDEINGAINREGVLELFIDAREAFGAAVSVSDDWTKFFALNREKLSRVHVLVGSKVVQLTGAIAQHLSRTGNLIQIYSDAELFDGKLNSN
jgi:phage tail sheath gpL-like